MFEGYFARFEPDLLSRQYKSKFSISQNSNHLFSSLTFNDKFTNPSSTCVFSENVGMFGFSKDGNEFAFSYTYQNQNTNNKLKPTISYKNDVTNSRDSIKIHLPYKLEFGKIVFADEIFLNTRESCNSIFNIISSHSYTAFAKLNQQLLNGQLLMEESLHILPVLQFSVAGNYSNMLIATTLSPTLQRIKGEYSRNNMIYFAKIDHINRKSFPFKINVGALYIRHFMSLAVYYMQKDIELLTNNLNPIKQLVKMKLMLKNQNIKFASKIVFNNNLEITPKAAIKFKFGNKTKIILGSYSKTKELVFSFQRPFGKKGIFNFDTICDWTGQNPINAGVHLRFDHD